jgi:hypothetical protein
MASKEPGHDETGRRPPDSNLPRRGGLVLPRHRAPLQDPAGIPWLLSVAFAAAATMAVLALHILFEA